ncbi:RHS domain-containing protein [Methylogaea oryzae]|uniref:RHS protein conserved region domain-containing protein n=1 Tax=Methylogaea oryzae TaxID=1295382 RepID=A0A8D4VR77_9GAMM|nr:RHS domain-containing protein [Methylogaea oryzae]BBL71814.1 hypothetical protein MoryE10_24200 [Methylogaea oryzae]
MADLRHGKHRFAYNDAGRLGQAESADYRYNGLGQRIAKTVKRHTTHFVYDAQGQLLGEYDDSGKPLQETVYLGRTPVAVSAQGDEDGKTAAIHYVHTDHLGAPRALLDQDNQIAWTWHSDPYGAAWSGQGKDTARGKIA